MLTINAEIISALIDNMHDSGLYSDNMEAAIAEMDCHDVSYDAPLDLENEDYPTQIVLTATGVKGDKVTVEYRTNAGTPDERVHIACHIYTRDIE
jgi:hypothetical protein